MDDAIYPTYVAKRRNTFINSENFLQKIKAQL